MSHPAWVCGLKQYYEVEQNIGGGVTPCVGVWIETSALKDLASDIDVTPCVGVWIETLNYYLYFMVGACHTLRGCVD